MNDFEKQFQDKLGQEHKPLSGQEQDVLWDSIASELDTDDLKANHMRLRRRIAGSIAAAGILAAVGWSLYPTAESPIVAKEVQKQKQAYEALSPPLPQSTATVNETPAHAANSESNLDAAAKDTKRSAAAEAPAIALQNRLAVNAPRASSQNLTAASSETKVERASSSRALDLLLFMELKNPPESGPNFGAELVPMAMSIEEKYRANDGANRSFNLRIYQGPTWSKFSYLEQGGTDLLGQNDNMKSDGSWSAGAMMEFEALRQSWGVGIEWNEFVHQLNYRGTFEQFNTIDNALLEIELDPNTGDTLNSVYGVAEVLVVTQRRVVHHNRLRTIAIPLEWQKHWSLTSVLHGGIALGALVQWRTSLSGRTFTGQEGSIVNYSDSEFPSNRIAVAPMYRMHATYDIAPDWSIELSVRMASIKHASLPSAELPDPSGQFKGRLLTGNLSFGVARAIR